MQKDSKLYDFTQQLQGTIFRAAFKEYLGAMSDEERAARPTPPPLLQLKGGYAESPAWVLIQVLEFAPDPLTVELFRKRAVYSAPNLTLGLLELLASEKYLDKRGDGYVLTDAGRVITDRMTENRILPFADFVPIVQGDILKLEQLMWRIIEASLKSDGSTWCLAHSRNRAPSVEAPILAKIVQYGSDFNAFRDDAHMAAYSQYNVEGHVWEAFNYVVNEQAQTADALYDKLAYRGFYTEDWQAVLNDLTEQGWISPNSSFYAVNETGQEIFAEVEAITDEMFFAPWATLSEEGYSTLIDLMQSLNEACNEILNN